MTIDLDSGNSKSTLGNDATASEKKLKNSFLSCCLRASGILLTADNLVSFEIDLVSKLPTPVAEHPNTPNDIAKSSERRSGPNTVTFAGISDKNRILDDDELDLSYCEIINDSDHSNHSGGAMSSSQKSFAGQSEPRTPVSKSSSAAIETDGAPPTPPLPSGLNRIAVPPSPGRQRKADISKMGRSINRPVEEKPLLDEIREVLAQSYLMFLLADLRHMSATGRISTKYENLAVDSDICKRDTAELIACVSDRVTDNEVERIGYFRGLSPAVIMAIVILEIRDTAVKAAEEKRSLFKVGDKKRDDTSLDIDNDDQFVGYENNQQKKKLTEDSMVSLMRCYSRMVSEDLVSEIPSVRRRRMTMQSQNNYNFGTSAINILSPSGANTSNSNYISNSFYMFKSNRATDGSGLSERSDGSSKATFSSPISKSKLARNTSAPPTLRSVTEEQEVVSEGFEMLPLKDSGSDQPNADGKKLIVEKVKVGESVDDRQSSGTSTQSFKDEQVQEVPGKSMSKLFSPGKWNTIREAVRRDLPSDGMVTQPSFRQQIENLNQKTKEKSKQMADKITNDFNQQVDNMLTSSTEREFQELTDVFFDQGEKNEGIKQKVGKSLSRKEMVDAMRKDVEARNDKGLQFLSKLFKEGTISKLMAESHARIVWVNDWYPMKDLTYAISVDALQKRVMVVFRGAITTQDWKSAFNMGFHSIRNPVKEEYEGRKEILRVFSGLYTYLFRKRKDTGTTKYDEIANMVHKYGLERIGPDYKLFVTGHSLGGALTHFFSFYASTDKRFTKNGPVKGIAFASPYIGGHSWADAFRNQERKKLLQLVQCRNSSDVIPRIPANFKIGKRGPLWRHVGIGVTLPPLPSFGRKWKPLVHYWGKEKSCLDSTYHGFRRNIIFHFAYLRPWTLDRAHTLFELQDRLMYGELKTEEGGGFALLQSTLDELYEQLEDNDFDTFSKTKWWNRTHLLRRKGENESLTDSAV
jgi:hypothetical protein